VQVFAVALCALAGGHLTVVGAARRVAYLSRPGTAISLTMLTALTGSLAVVGYVAVAHPAAARDPAHVYSLLLAAVLTGYLCMALTPPGYTATHPLTRRLAPGTVLVGATLAAAVSRSRRPAIETGLWAGMISALLLFATGIPMLLTTGLPAPQGPATGTTEPISDYLGGGVSMLLLLPAATLLLGTIGGTPGNRLTGRAGQQ
jgi:hypothetical protein